MNSRSSRALSLVASLALFLTGCQSAKLDSYVDANYSAKQIQRVVVLPMSNTTLSAGQANELSRSFAQSLQRKNPSLVIIGAGEAVQKINNANLADDWAKHLMNFASSGIPNTKTVERVGELLEVDAVIQGTMLAVSQRDSNGYNYPITRVSLRYTMLSAKNVRILWELTGEGVKQPYAYTASPIIDAVRIAHEKIISSIP